MKKVILQFGIVCIFFFLPTTVVAQKLLYLQYEHYPKRVVVGEIFPVTIKVFNLLGKNGKISYKFLTHNNYKVLNYVPYRKYKGKYYLDTFYFQVKKPNGVTPTIKGYLKQNNHLLQVTTLGGVEIEALALNPRKDFCGIVAKDFQIVKSKTTIYDENNNIVVLSAVAKNTFLSDFHLNGVVKQGFESKKDAISESKMIYYAIINKKIDSLDFSYFNTVKNKFIKLSIPIVVDDDRVSTQSDLKPKDQSKKYLKIYIAAAIIFLSIALFIWKRKYYYFIGVILPGLYIGYLMMEVEQICVKKGTKVRILPLKKSTVFELLLQDSYVDKLATSQGYFKIELPNKKIGWVSEKDTCSR